ncbi:MAG: MBL fold metallo-hydrolase RNA specificity domain-containing protein [Candidatus Bathyarchaeia archaeon]|jgi:ribonuclease J
MMKIACYGGVGDIGGNKLLVKMDKDSIFLDFGLSYKEEALFFEEFLQPRSGCKLHDLLKLGMIPRINGVYRQDAILPTDFENYNIRAHQLWKMDIQSYEEAKQQNAWHPDALFISHAHLDHCGYAPYLGDFLFMCSETTKKLMDAIAEIGNLQGLDKQLTVTKDREMGKLKTGFFPGEPKVDYSKDEANRKYCCLENKKPQPVGKEMTVTGYSVDHSIPGAMSCIVESKGSQVLYTGDVRFHGKMGYNLGNELAGLKPDVMFCEGTRIDKTVPDNEKKVEEELVEKFSECEGLAMVGFTWKDIDRYETVRDAAIKSGRTPVFDPRLAYLLARLDRSVYDEGAKVFLERCGCMLYSPGDYSNSKHKAGDMAFSEWSSQKDNIHVDTKHLDNGVSALELNQNPSTYVLHLDYFRFKNILDFTLPKGSIFVRAQCEPFNDRMELSGKRLLRWLKQFDINASNGWKPYQIHASGHASGPELQEMIDKIQPKLLIPVHTEHPEKFTNKSGQVHIPVKGVEKSI